MGEEKPPVATGKREFKVAEDVALSEFDRFAEEMDLDIDPANMDEDDLSTFKKQKGRIIKAMRYGDLMVNEEGEAVYTPWRSDYRKPITFHERTGASLMAMDSKKKNHDVSKMYAVLADMTKVHQSDFAKLKGADIKICEAIFALLMD